MAIRMQEGRKRPFFVYWIDPASGKRKSQSCATREEAEKLNAWVAYQCKYEKENFKLPPEITAQKEKAQAEKEEREKKREEVKAKAERVEKIVKPKNLSLERTAFLYLKEKQFKHDSLLAFVRHTKLLMEKYGAMPINQIDRLVLKEMQAVLIDTGIRLTTVRRRITTIRTVIRWAYNNELLEKLPIMPPLVNGRTQHFVPPTIKEVRAIFDVAPDYMRRMIVLGYYVGMRVGKSEMFRLRWDDVDFDRHLIRVPQADKGAAEEVREVPISSDTERLLKAWRDLDADKNIQYVLHRGISPITMINYKVWKKVLVMAGITRNIRPYDLRHGFATQLIANGVDVGTVAQLMGHTSPVMVLKHYQHVTNLQKKNAVNLMPSMALQCVQTA